MGHRMEVYVNEKIAEKIVDISKQFGVEAQIIGRVETSEKKKLTIKSITENLSINAFPFSCVEMHLHKCLGLF